MTETIGSIIRIDKPKDNPKGTHGWQVRLPIGQPRKYHSKLFSDGVFGGKEAALAAAQAYRQEQLQQHPEKYKALHNRPFAQKPPSNNTSGRVGVYRSHSYHGKTGKKQEFWAAYCPRGPYGRPWTKQFYIVTHGEEGARELAVELRDMWEEAAMQGTEAIDEFFEAYQEGWL